MIVFNYETEFKLQNEGITAEWIASCIEHYGRTEGELNFIFCNDVYLHKLNVEFLDHDTYTDIISFDYSMGKLLSGDVFISVERVRENAKKYIQNVDNEMNRVIIHGILHFVGLRDKSDKDKKEMRVEEEKCLALLNKD